MVLKKGFLLIELMITLFLLSTGILFFLSQYAQVGKLSTLSLQAHTKLMIMQAALEEARMSKDACYKSYTIDAHTVEVSVESDAVVKNFLHIIITLYDEDNKKDIWFSGVTVLHEV